MVKAFLSLLFIVYFFQTSTARHPEKDNTGFETAASLTVAEEIQRETDQLGDLNREETMDIDAAGQGEQDESNQDVREKDFIGLLKRRN